MKRKKVGEYKQGIALLEQVDKLPAELAEFVGRLKQILPQDNLYCGSPWLAQALTRDSDKMRLFELHPADFVHLQTICAKSVRRAKCKSAKRTVIRA